MREKNAEQVNGSPVIDSIHPERAGGAGVSQSHLKTKEPPVEAVNPAAEGRKKRVFRPDAMHFQRLVCPHCGKEGTGPIMKRHHFDRCKSKPPSV